jgi:hypothetical protein
MKRHYCIVRADLPRGVLAAQLIHAAGESGPAEPGTYAVALAASNERQLANIELRLQFEGTPHRSIREPDPPWCGALMAIGVPPLSTRPAALKSLPLLK